MVLKVTEKSMILIIHGYGSARPSLSRYGFFLAIVSQFIIRCKGTAFFANMQVFVNFYKKNYFFCQKNLDISSKCIIFAPCFCRTHFYVRNYGETEHRHIYCISGAVGGPVLFGYMQWQYLVMAVGGSASHGAEYIACHPSAESRNRCSCR